MFKKFSLGEIEGLLCLKKLKGCCVFILKVYPDDFGLDGGDLNFDKSRLGTYFVICYMKINIARSMFFFAS